MATPIPASLGRGAGRLDLLRSNLNSSGARAQGQLSVAANVANGETVTIGTDVFVVDIINTDSTKDTAAILPNNASDVAITMAAHGLVVGDLIRIESEIMRVKRVRSTSSIWVSRARCGTAAAGHTAGQDIFVSDAIGVDVAAGRIPVGLVTTLTPTVFLAALAAEINTDAGKSNQSAMCRAIKIGNNTMLLVKDALGASALATTETLAGSGNVWAAATLTGGSDPVKKRQEAISIVPTAADVTAGVIYRAFDFTPTIAIPYIVATTGGAVKLWAGATQIVPASGDTPAYVSLTNGTDPDWAATDTIYLFVSE